MSKKNKIVFVCPWYSENMGYIHNCLSKSISDLGNDVHIITSNTQQYFNSDNYKETYEKFLGPAIVDCCTYDVEGVTIHRLPYKLFKTEVHMNGLYSKLKELNPNVVHVFSVDSILTFKLAIFQIFLRYKLFASNHTLLSVFPLDKNWEKMSMYKKISWKVKHYLPGRFINSRLSLVINPSEEGTYISEKYYGIDRNKVKFAPLGVDTSIFKKDLKFEGMVRKQLDIEKDMIICIYTGRFSAQKNPIILAKAIEILNKNGHNYIGVFVGDGDQKENISNYKNCYCLGFIAHEKLYKYYNASDIAVWPREESTSMLDAAACGTPIVVSNQVLMKERYEGNGLTYVENSPEDLAKVLLELNSNQIREMLGSMGLKKMKDKFSWDAIAIERLIDYGIVNKKKM